MLGHDISGLMFSTRRRAGRDEYGNRKKAILPLLLPTVLEGHPITSNSRLFSLPAEILGDIMDLIADDQTTLAALALVNSDCRQLARTCQFAQVRFDYSPRSNMLLRRLSDEYRIRNGSAVPVPGNATRPPFLGSCIRRVTVRPLEKWVTYRHGDLFQAVWGNSSNRFSMEQRGELNKEAFAPYVAAFRTPILAALEQQTMPNLEALSWDDGVCLDDTFCSIVAHLPIRHLKLSRVNIAEPYRFEPPMAPPTMPLESLSFGARLCTDELHREEGTNDASTSENRNFSPSIATLLRRCSATLGRLSFSLMAFENRQPISFGQECINFPRLRHLDLSSLIGTPDAVAWSSLLSAPLRHLSLPYNTSDPVFRQCLSASQPFRDLETLVMPHLNEEENLDFISRHPHARKLSLTQGESQQIDLRLIPLISNGRWSNLTSLSLAWKKPEVEEQIQPETAALTAASLAAIGRIESLEQLCLSAVDCFGCHNHWLVDHDMVRSSLRGLTRLKRLAFARDTYMANNPHPTLASAEPYYHYREVTPADRAHVLEWLKSGGSDPGPRQDGDDDDGDGPELGDNEIWERAHCNRMIREAEKYAAALPQLEWIYCGQRPMGVRNEETLRGITRVAVPLGETRDTCWTLLRRMFSMGDDE